MSKKESFQPMPPPLLTYGAEKLILTKRNINKIQVMAKVNGKLTVGNTLRDEFSNKLHIRNITGVSDAVETILHLNWN